MPDSEAKKRWVRDNTTRIVMNLNHNTDWDVLKRLKEQPSIQGYIKSLIRTDIEREDNTISINEFVRNILENDSMGAYKEKMDLETAKNNLENFVADEMELPEGITPESYMNAWNGLVDSMK